MKGFAVDYQDHYTVSGVFAKVAANGVPLGHTGTNYAAGIRGFDMTLSRYNGIYGGSKVIPTSRKCIFIIKF